jgi:prophage regulatory protein
MSEAIPREALLTIRDVQRLTTLSNTELYRRMSAGVFPTPRRLGETRVAWRAYEIFDWLDALPSAGVRQHKCALPSRITPTPAGS